MEIKVPENADAVWVSISSRVSRMFSSHAILYLTRNYKRHAVQCAEQCLECNLPWDVALAFYQKDYNVYALKMPVFYQARERSIVHDFEVLTRGPIG